MQRLAVFQLGYLLIVILFGAVVRMTGSGAGCGQNWPLCHGEFVPMNPTLHTIVEYSHRISSGLSLPLALFLLAGFWRAKDGVFKRLGFFWQLLTVVFLIIEAAIGASLVLLEHVAESQSSYRALTMSLHLVNTFLLVACSLGVVISVHSKLHILKTDALPGEIRLARLGAFLLLIAGVSGAVTALGDTVFPSSSVLEAMSLAMQTASHLFVKLRIFHPFIAVGVGFGVIHISIWLMRRGWANISYVKRIVGLVVFQWTLGFLNIGLNAPEYLQLAHLATAQLLWLSYISIPLGYVVAQQALRAGEDVERVEQLKRVGVAG